MHSHDRSLIASLGFSDPDKKNPRHDLACQYLMLPVNRHQLIKMVGGCGFRDIPEPTLRRDVYDLRPQYEVHLIKGEDKYITTVGFIDVVALYYTQTVMVDDSTKKEEIRYSLRPMFIEVKIGKIEFGDLLRQIQFYNTYLPLGRDFRWYYDRESKKCGNWFVATAYPVTKRECEILRDSGIIHVRLGEAFDQWVEEQEECSDNGAVSPEIGLPVKKVVDKVPDDPAIAEFFGSN